VRRDHLQHATVKIQTEHPEENLLTLLPLQRNKKKRKRGGRVKMMIKKRSSSRRRRAKEKEKEKERGESEREREREETEESAKYGGSSTTTIGASPQTRVNSAKASIHTRFFVLIT
jgi:hypothetical protein